MLQIYARSSRHGYVICKNLLGMVQAVVSSYLHAGPPSHGTIKGKKNIILICICCQLQDYIIFSCHIPEETYQDRIQTTISRTRVFALLLMMWKLNHILLPNRVVLHHNYTSDENDDGNFFTG